MRKLVMPIFLNIKKAPTEMRQNEITVPYSKQQHSSKILEKLLLLDLESSIENYRRKQVKEEQVLIEHQQVRTTVFTSQQHNPSSTQTQKKGSDRLVSPPAFFNKVANDDAGTEESEEHT